MKDGKLPVFEKILDEIISRKQNRAFIVGITGIDTSGKTIFANSLEKFLVSRNYPVQAIHLDDFHNPMSIRYSGGNQAENYFNKSFDIETIINKLLKPIRENIDFPTELTLLDLQTDKYEIRKEFSFSADTIVIMEGVFLFRKELSPYIDYGIFLEIPFEESKKRAKRRDIEAVLKKYDEKYLPAQKKYLREYPPTKTADMLIDNSDWEHPKIIQPS